MIRKRKIRAELTSPGMKFTPREETRKTMPHDFTRRRFLAQVLIMAGGIAAPSFAFCQTRGMQRRQERREDRAGRMEERGEQMEERSDDPLGIRGVERREGRRDLRQSRREDRRERIY